MTAVVMRAFREDRGPAFYEMALRCAQSLWRQGLPAQALLQLNRAMSAELTGQEDVVRTWPMPYQAKVWIMRHHEPEHFIGNPRRHYQHLATRMSGPQLILRTWRAWACWYLACKVQPDWPADEEQILKESITEPTMDAIMGKLEIHGLEGELEVWKEAAGLKLKDADSPKTPGISGDLP